ncbi:hypothetical protein GCM10023195_73980 [Actinoallomurus liliacearum]|uniref:Uncharacterized protein n=1 Tax=Actinoallomurus liliacearum TaxID=1080073 RepID=A0ABP8TXG3_9ACTN
MAENDWTITTGVGSGKERVENVPADQVTVTPKGGLDIQRPDPGNPGRTTVEHHARGTYFGMRKRY